ncbi:hypothetical protein BOQ63_000600 (plasmid) [Streptomyces viridifaciens]|nr:hypothetical protein BOQ63_000600 [Streptomyces viridifaciens]
MAADDLYRGDHLPQVAADILALPTRQLQRIAVIRIGQLTRGELSGAALEARRGWPDLSDCRKLYFDVRQGGLEVGRGYTPQWRIVYRLTDPPPGPDQRLLLQVVAVGARPRGAVYVEAGDRLGRTPPQRTPIRQPAAPDAGAPARRSLAEAQRAALERASRSVRWRL